MTLTFLARQPEDVTVLPDSAPRLLPLPGPYNSAGHLQPAYHQVSVSVFSCFLMHFLCYGKQILNDKSVTEASS